MFGLWVRNQPVEEFQNNNNNINLRELANKNKEKQNYNPGCTAKGKECLGTTYTNKWTPSDPNKNSFLVDYESPGTKNRGASNMFANAYTNPNCEKWEKYEAPYKLVCKDRSLKIGDFGCRNQSDTEFLYNNKRQVNVDFSPQQLSELQQECKSFNEFKVAELKDASGSKVNLPVANWKDYQSVYNQYTQLNNNNKINDTKAKAEFEKLPYYLDTVDADEQNLCNKPICEFNSDGDAREKCDLNSKLEKELEKNSSYEESVYLGECVPYETNKLQQGCAEFVKDKQLRRQDNHCGKCEDNYEMITGNVRQHKAREQYFEDRKKTFSKNEFGVNDSTYKSHFAPQYGDKCLPKNELTKRMDILEKILKGNNNIATALGRNNTR